MGRRKGIAERYRRLSLWSRLGVWGAIASIVGLAVYLMSSRQSPVTQAPSIHSSSSANVVVNMHPVPPPESEPPRLRPGATQQNLLSEDEIRMAIGKALREGDLEAAVDQVSGLKDSPMKREECARVFEFCIKNAKLSEAEVVTQQCWDGKDKHERLARIQHERLKQ